MTTQDDKKPLEQRFEQLSAPFFEFISDQRTASVILLLATVTALILANSPLASLYHDVIATPFGFVIGDSEFSMSVHHWINDGMMTIFFFVIGLEVKREFLAGELQNIEQALPVIIAAVGGMLLPALIFVAFNLGLDTIHGWGIPMATDTAFAVGILALLAKRIPAALFVFLTALAIIDDIGAIVVIALFYTSELNMEFLFSALAFIAMLCVLNLLGVRRPTAYFAIGILVWLTMLGSGIHATLAGVLVAFTVPARPKRDPSRFLNSTRKLLDRFEDINQKSSKPILNSPEKHDMVDKIKDESELMTTPLRRWEHSLEHPVLLLVMPVFALVNAGIAVDMDVFINAFSDQLVLGIIGGLVIGKCIGITAFTWLALRFGFGRLPDSVTLRHIVGVGLLAGIGFTMSIFISGLGFAGQPEELLNTKIAILIASTLAGTIGFAWLRWGTDAPQ